MKKTYLFIFIIFCIAILLFIFIQNNKDNSQVNIDIKQNSFDPRNSSFKIDSETINLKNGKYETYSVPNSNSKNITTYFGNEAEGDLNGDGLKDIAFLITQNTGGTGLFYYVVVALNTGNRYKTTNAFFVGDRIAPQSTEIKSGELHVNYAERRSGQPMSSQPDQGAVLLLKVNSLGVLEGLMK
jgi:hypothetical protein